MAEAAVVSLKFVDGRFSPYKKHALEPKIICFTNLKNNNDKKPAFKGKNIQL